MKFCKICDSKLYNTSEGFKCKKCDNYNPNEKKVVTKTVFSNDESFPYIKNEYYVHKEICNRLGFSVMPGINLNKNLHKIVLFRNAHILKPNQTNIYLDRYDSETGIYYYVGRGLTGNQTLSGDNGFLKNAKEHNFTVHLFWQQNANSTHQYVGEVSVDDVISEKQPDKNGKSRDVFVFLLKPKTEEKKELSFSTGMKLQTLKEFNSVITNQEGFVVLTDIASTTKIHSVSCQRLKENYFFEKMVENNGKYGLYLWYSSKKEAQAFYPDTSNCKFCNA